MIKYKKDILYLFQLKPMVFMVNHKKISYNEAYEFNEKYDVFCRDNNEYVGFLTWDDWQPFGYDIMKWVDRY